MTRSTRLWFGIAAFVITVNALLACLVLALRLGEGLAITTSMLTAFICVFLGISVKRRRSRRPDPTSTSIKHELDSRKLRAKGARVQFR